MWPRFEKRMLRLKSPVFCLTQRHWFQLGNLLSVGNLLIKGGTKFKRHPTLCHWLKGDALVGNRPSTARLSSLSSWLPRLAVFWLSLCFKLPHFPQDSNHIYLLPHPHQVTSPLISHRGNIKRGLSLLQLTNLRPACSLAQSFSLSHIHFKRTPSSTQSQFVFNPPSSRTWSHWLSRPIPSPSPLATPHRQADLLKSLSNIRKTETLGGSPPRKGSDWFDRGRSSAFSTALGMDRVICLKTTKHFFFF